MPIKAYYDASVSEFLRDDADRILGILTVEHHHALEEQQRWAWIREISILKSALHSQTDGQIFLELYIPRMGKRADAVLISKNVVFVLEFKAGASEHLAGGLDQVEDYALDLKNFHEGSHAVSIVPVLISTNAADQPLPQIRFAIDGVAAPLATNATSLGALIDHVCAIQAFPAFEIDDWRAKGYRPTPTIIEAAQVLYQTHRVTDISRSDAGATNLKGTSDTVDEIIDHSRLGCRKAICFVTGVPGSGKTLAGLNIATRRSEEHRDEHAVFLSGNGPLVEVLREALARDKSRREGMSKRTAEREVESFIQNIHHFRDHYLSGNEVPIEKVVVFDEAQRAWTREQAATFMQRKRGHADFNFSEPEFLISVMNRHQDWCTIVCLIGDGQEINTGEAGISEWISAIQTRFSDWRVYVSPRISLPEYGAEIDVETFLKSPQVKSNEMLHLAVSMRSFRAEALSQVVASIVDNKPDAAGDAYGKISSLYPIYLTRDLNEAREWLRSKARGSERFGLVASSGAQRLRPEGIHIKADIEPTNWFLNDRNDVRSSFYLEDVASEFAIQGLELDWVGVCWDGDFHQNSAKWVYQVFKGTKWQCIRDNSKRMYLKNAYRVLLTRARQGMVIFVPKGEIADRTRPPAFYDGTFDFLRQCGIPLLD